MAATAPVGLDIGSTAIRAVEMVRSKGVPVINDFGQIALPPGAIVGGVIADSKAVTAALRALWGAQKFRSKNVVLGVTHQQLVVREVEVPNLSEKELKLALPHQVRDVLPLPVDEAVLDFFPLEDAGPKGGRKDVIRGLLIAAPKEGVIELVRAVERAGLHVSQVDLACFAALRAAAELADDTEAVIDIGANTTSIVIHADGVPKIVRTIPRGGAEITTLMSQRLGLEPAEAELVKCRAGLLAADSPETREVIMEAIRPLLAEIRSSLAYFASGNPTVVRRLALVGGAAQLPGLTAELERLLGVPTTLANPLRLVRDSRQGGRHDVLDRYRCAAAVSIGLMMSAA